MCAGLIQTHSTAQPIVDDIQSPGTRVLRLSLLGIHWAQGRTSSAQGRETAAETEAAVAALSAEELASMNAGSDRSSDGRRGGGESPRGLAYAGCVAAAAGGHGPARTAGPSAVAVLPPPHDSLRPGSKCCRQQCLPGCRVADIKAAFSAGPPLPECPLLGDVRRGGLGAGGCPCSGSAAAWSCSSA